MDQSYTLKELLTDQSYTLGGSTLHCEAKVCVFSKIYDGKIINIPYRNVHQRT